MLKIRLKLAAVLVLGLALAEILAAKSQQPPQPNPPLGGATKTNPRVGGQKARQSTGNETAPTIRRPTLKHSNPHHSMPPHWLARSRNSAQVRGTHGAKSNTLTLAEGFQPIKAGIPAAVISKLRQLRVRDLNLHVDPDDTRVSLVASPRNQISLTPSTTCTIARHTRRAILFLCPPGVRKTLVRQCR
jgi:hypothetical protein